MSEKNYLRGAFIAYEPDGYPDDKKRRVIPFRFNPETLSRQLAVEQGQKDPGTQGAKASGSQDSAGDASSGRLKETFQVVVRLDYADRHDAAGNLPPEYGIAPEVAALEDLLYGAESPTDDNSDGKEPVKQNPQRPIVLFIWGRRRVLPVRITGMTIEETMFNQHLNPVRAEVSVSMEVLQEADAKNSRAVAEALDFTNKKRKEMARMFLENTADQGSNILPL